MNLYQTAPNRDIRRRTSTLRARATAIAGLALISATGVTRSGTIRPELGDFGNAVQAPVGGALTAICDQFVLNFGTPDNTALTPAEVDLFSRCLELEHTANFLLQNGGPIDSAIFAIDSLEALGAALQQQGTEESAAEGTNSTKVSRGRVLLKRLAAVRGGAGGFSVAGLSLGVDGQFFGADPPKAGEPPVAMQAPGNADEQVGAMFPAERWGLFVNGMVSFGDKDGTALENGFEFTVPGLMLGIDRRLGDDAILGGSLGYESFDGDFDVTTTVAGGELQADLVSLSVYSSYHHTKYYIDGIATYGMADYEMTRNIVYPTITRTATSDTEGERLELTAAFGYHGQRDSFQYSPNLRVSHLSVDIDDYVETEEGGLALAVADQKIDSLQSIVGCQLAWTVSRARGVIIPHIRAEWYHEFANDDHTITAGFAADPFGVAFSVPTEEPDENYFAIGGGVSGVWQRGMQGFIEIETLQGLEDLSNYVLTAGIRFTPRTRPATAAP